MRLSIVATNTSKFLKQHSPEILTALGASGVITTAYLTGVATWHARGSLEATYTDPDKIELKEKVEHVWRFYIPPVVSGTLTVCLIFSARQAGTRRTAAAVSAYSLTEKAYSEYRERVVEQLGEKAEQRIRDEIKQDAVSEHGPKEIIITGGGDVLCCELLTHRYFKSDMETLRRIQNEINSRINNELYVALDEFYDLVGLEHTSQSDILGWDSDKLMDLMFSTVISEGGVPCLAFNYNYLKSL